MIGASVSASASARGPVRMRGIEAVQVSRRSVTRETKTLLANQTGLGRPLQILGLGMGRRLEAKEES